MKPSSVDSISIHLTNVTGTGATQLLESLLPALFSCYKVHISKIFLPATGSLSHYSPVPRSTISNKYKRYLPRVVSRFLECTILSYKFDEKYPILVLGDLPLRVSIRQILFVQTPHLIAPDFFAWHPNALKYAIARIIFRLNLNRVSAFIVQTEVMKVGLVDSYPSLRNKVHIVRHPVPRWLLEIKPGEYIHKPLDNRGLRLFYPAAQYPHKNHNLLAKIEISKLNIWPVESLILTVDTTRNPAIQVPWLNCVGTLSSAAMIEAYGRADGLLFLSKQESLGFPLLEAMYLGMPIVCPDLAYARLICGEQAIYFDPDSIETLQAAITVLKERLLSNWLPDWSVQLREIPKNWDEVASKVIDITLNSTDSI